MHNDDIRSVLGRAVPAPQRYAREVLVRELRQNSRAPLGLESGQLPFVGVDVWNGYEVSALCENGLPTAFIAKVSYACTSPYLVESKSMKLYWNSFNMERLGRSVNEVRSKLIEVASKDLSELLETDVRVALRDACFHPEHPPAWPFRHEPASLLEGQPWAQDLTFDTYTESPRLLDEGAQEFPHAQTLHASSSLLKSNCKITSQADWGDVFIRLTGRRLPSPQGLLKYLVSFRDECHFHEEIIESIYQRLWTRFGPEALVVTGLYVRRGGWDICPHRASHSSLLETRLTGEGETYVKTPRQ